MGTTSALANPAFRLLGPLEVVRKGIVHDVPAGRQQALLATLLLRPNEVVSAPALVEQVWGEGADRSVLNVCVMRLRRSLEDPDHQVLRGEGGGYRIAVDEAAVDLHRFRQLCTSAGQARERGELTIERRRLHEALSLWRGEAFAGISSPAIQSEVVPILDEERLGAIERRIAADLECGAHAEVIRELRELVVVHSFRERFWYQLMLALYRSGRSSEALETFLNVRSTFAEDLGVEPGIELRELHQRILNGDAALLTPTTTAPVATTIPVRLPRQESKPEPEQEPEPDPWPRLVPAQLPPAVPGFVGRDPELAELNRLTEPTDPAAPIVLLTGSPGVGKTALAVHWATRQRERCSDGQLYVDLGGYANGPTMRPIEALTRFLRATGMPADQIPTDLSEAATLYRSVTADRRLLVLLDNADSADQVRPLLPGGRNCVVLVTSRDQLTGLTARDGACRLVLDVLADSEARALLAGIVGRDRLNAEPGKANELARACGNLPLALRIAAANLTSHRRQSVAAYVTELDADRLDALEVDGDDQSAVRAAFRFSYTRLPDPARRMFRLLGLFPGPEIGPEAAAALADTDIREATRLLDQLVSAHLATPRGTDRLVLHDLLRCYAAELVELEQTEDERIAAIQRLYDHYTRTAEATARKLYPQLVRLPLSPAASATPAEFAEHEQATIWLHDEWANLVAAVQYASVHGPYLDACRLAVVLRGYLHTKRQIVDWLTITRAGLTAARAASSVRAEAATRLSLADLHRCQGQYRAAVTHYERVLALSQYDNWVEGQSAAHNGLGSFYHMKGRLDLAAEHLVHALRLNRSAGWVAAQAANLGNLGGIQLQLGRMCDAVASLRESVKLTGREGSRANQSRSLAKLGEALCTMGDYEAARAALLEALELQQQMGDREYLPFTLCELAVVRLCSGELGRAAELARTARTLAREIVGGRDVEIGAIRVLAGVDEAAGRYDCALLRYQHASDLTRKAGLWYLHVRTLIGLATSSLALDRSGPALRYAGRAIELARRFGYQLLERQAFGVRCDAVARLPEPVR